MVLAALAAVSEAVPNSSEAAPPAARGVVEVAVLALVVSLLSLGWQIVSWWKGQRPRAKIGVAYARAYRDARFFVAYDEEGGETPQPAPGSGRGALLARVMNLGVHAFAVTAVSFEPPKGAAGTGLHVLSTPPADPDNGLNCTIPGVVDGHSQGTIWIYMEDLVEVFPPGSKIVVKVTLGSGTVLYSEPVSMDGLLKADADRPAAAEPSPIG